MAETFLVHGPAALKGGDRHQIVVHVDVETLRDSTAGRCGFEDGPSAPAYSRRFELSRGAFERAVQAGVTFEPDGNDRWVGLYRIRGVRIDSLGRTAFDLGDCSMFSHCELEFDATTPCHSRGWLEYAAVDAHWCLVVHNHL